VNSPLDWRVVGLSHRAAHEFVVVSIVGLLTACATERFGREQRLTAAETASLTCAQIDLEIAKVDGFLTDTETQWDNTHGRRFLGFLADFGIGNHMEHGDAIESADTRRQQLLDLRAVRQCPGTPAPRPTLD
jgi:hypothetical protein